MTSEQAGALVFEPWNGDVLSYHVNSTGVRAVGEEEPSAQFVVVVKRSNPVADQWLRQKHQDSVAVIFWEKLKLLTPLDSGVEAFLTPISLIAAVCTELCERKEELIKAGALTTLEITEGGGGGGSAEEYLTGHSAIAPAYNVSRSCFYGSDSERLRCVPQALNSEESFRVYCTNHEGGAGGAVAIPINVWNNACTRAKSAAVPVPREANKSELP